MPFRLAKSVLFVKNATFFEPGIVIAATGPSLCRAIAERVASYPVVAVNDAWRLFPHAVLYASDFTWWRRHADELRTFAGRKLTCPADVNGPADIAALAGWGVEILPIEAGQCSGYGAIRAALYLGFKRLLLAGFDMRAVNGKRHFFGDHEGLRNTSDFSFALPDFERLAAHMPEGVTVTNCTPDSALRAFPFAKLEDCI